MNIKALTFCNKTDPKVIDTINRLARLEQRKPHDTARRLILEVGRARLEQIAPSVGSDTQTVPDNLTEVKEKIQ